MAYLKTACAGLGVPVCDRQGTILGGVVVPAFPKLQRSIPQSGTVRTVQ